VSGASARLEVKGCESGGLIVSKKIDGAPAGYTGQFTFLVQCATSSGPYQKIVTVNYPTPGFVTLTDVPPGSQCTVTEGQMPATPSGYNWSGLPVYSPEGGVVTTTDHGGQVTAINTLKPCVETGQVRITKIIKGVPKDFTGTFTGTLQCWTGGHLSTFPDSHRAERPRRHRREHPPRQHLHLRRDLAVAAPGRHAVEPAGLLAVVRQRLAHGPLLPGRDRDQRGSRMLREGPRNVRHA
jgi:hypothetical protein